MTRAPLWDRAVTYGAVGVTRMPDLLEFPPRGFRAFERRAILGHGPERWEWASAQALSWGIQRRSGFHVDAEPAPVEATAQSYQPVGFDASGAPVAPALVGDGVEQVFADDGTPLVRPGDSAWLGVRFLVARLRFPARVVYVVDEPQRRGFAYGTLPGHAESGEELFAIERSDDGTVSLVIRAVSRPASFWWALVAPVLRLTQEFYTARYLRALVGPIPARAGAIPAAADARPAARPAAADARPAARSAATDARLDAETDARPATTGSPSPAETPHPGTPAR